LINALDIVIVADELEAEWSGSQLTLAFQPYNLK
jgi:hypothetical protein